MSDSIVVAVITGASTAGAVLISSVMAMISARRAAEKVDEVREKLAHQTQEITLRIEGVHKLVNSQLDAALTRIRDCQLKLARALAKIDRLETRFGLNADPDPNAQLDVDSDSDFKV